MTKGNKQNVLCYFFKNYFQPLNARPLNFASFYSLPTIHDSLAGAAP